MTMSMKEAGGKTGGFVTPAAASGCATCGHPLTMHSNGTTPCRAAACRKGPGDGPCQQFTADAGQHPEDVPVVLLAS
jgi:hypothetical protein